MNYTEDNKITADKKKRRLGLVVSIVLALISWILLLKDLTGAFLFSVLALLLLTHSLFKPALRATPAEQRPSLVIFLFSTVLNVLLLFFFYLVITPVGLIARLLGKDLFSQKIIKKTDNYWVKVPTSYWDPDKKNKASTIHW